MIVYPAVAFISGLWIGSYLPFFPISFLLFFSMAGMMLCWLEWTHRLTPRETVLIFCSVGLGVAYWSGSTWIHHQSNLDSWTRLEPVMVKGSIMQPVRRMPGRVVMVVDVTQAIENQVPISASGTLLVSWRNPDRSVFQGDHVQITARLREPYGTLNPGGFHYGTYLERKGIHATATISKPGQLKIINQSELTGLGMIWNAIDQWRAQIQQAATTTLQGPARGLFVGMVLGEQGYISQNVRDRFMNTGTVHIISISGSHLGLIAFMTFFLVKGLVLRLPVLWLEWLSLRITATRLGVLVTLPLVSFYTLMAGAEIATVRSLIMIVFVLLAVWLGRARHLFTILILAAVMGLLYHPPALYDISFQLSYISVLAIALVIKGKQAFIQEGDQMRSVKSSTMQTLSLWLMNTWWISLAVTLATVPLVAYHFNQIAWMGLFANFMVVPYVGFLVVPLGLISAVGVLLTGSEVLPLEYLNQRVLDGLVQIVQILADVPGVEWHVASPDILIMVGFYGLLVVGLVNVNRANIRWACSLLLGGVLILWCWSPRQGWDQNMVRVTFLDVGQGDATVVELPDGQVVLIDAGARYSRLDMGRAVVGPYLWDQGIRKIDHVIATHPQWDHMGGLAWVIEKFEVGHYWSNGVNRENVFFRRVQKAVRAFDLSEHVAWKGKEIARSGPCILKVLNPLNPAKSLPHVAAASHSGSRLNNQSIITKLDCGLHSFLFTADAELEALTRLNQLPHDRHATVVKVPHHGAKSSLHREWIHHLQTEAAVISVGRYNRYGHPKPEVLNAYRENNLPIYRTDRDGAVQITDSLHSPDLSIHTAQDQLVKRIPIDGSMVENELNNLRRIFRD